MSTPPPRHSDLVASRTWRSRSASRPCKPPPPPPSPPDCDGPAPRGDPPCRRADLRAPACGGDDAVAAAAAAVVSFVPWGASGCGEAPPPLLLPSPLAEPEGERSSSEGMFSATPSAACCCAIYVVGERGACGQRSEKKVWRRRGSLLDHPRTPLAEKASRTSATPARR
eukprot:COSAG01_NODE_1507_length_10090_cov_4.104694_7_plen_169_part_00